MHYVENHKYGKDDDRLYVNPHLLEWVPVYSIRRTTAPDWHAMVSGQTHVLTSQHKTDKRPFVVAMVDSVTGIFKVWGAFASHIDEDAGLLWQDAPYLSSLPLTDAMDLCLVLAKMDSPIPVIKPE